MTVSRKSKSGAYASASDALLDREAELERWLHEDVIAGHAEYMADPSLGVSADALLERIRARQA